MNDTKMVCPKCQGTMVRGFMSDCTASFHPLCTWCEGMPHHPSWFNTLDPPYEKCIPTVTFRCSECGYLETYAGDSFP